MRDTSEVMATDDTRRTHGLGVGYMGQTVSPGRASRMYGNNQERRMLTNDQRERIGAWVTAVAPRAVAYARSLVRDPSRAEDVVQECFYRLLRRANEYDLERDGIKLLLKAISNLCINQATREKALLSLDSSTDPDDGPVTLSDPGALSPERIAQHRELQNAVRDGLQTLPPLQRAAVELRALGMSKDEIADALGVSATNAGVLVYRGRQLLARALEPHLRGEVPQKNV
ncbi:sigma-70 family RNA polymerase sigma factor [Gemmata sp. JC673]|uniref:Sigma-70 family RNA polymerase sigma factor n=1 Tax=Gemmata algarum TaxID=2975278 RepID=A0ABU5FCC0_9BACT|nr:sigma-70 family RNA polymerase sigma factor [Gemmata algarum]MDY3563456.1 sigma-70 family RNA polymerase sigma factor [Gemmata algarum]